MNYYKFRLRTFSTPQCEYHLHCGSANELPMYYALENPTDVDQVFYCIDICAIPWNRNPPQNFKGILLKIDSRKSPPGFVKLLISQTSVPKRPTYYRRPSNLRESESGGPAIKIVLPRTKMIEMDGTELNIKRQEQDIDNVYAVYCPYWPKEVEEWRVRKRYHGWPDDKSIARIVRGGCHFVSKLRTWESSDDTEWRFSFSKAELLLINSWNKVQKQVYQYLRLIKKQTSAECGDCESKALQTYFFKTLMFWSCENCPQNCWSESNISNCVISLLNKFLDCLTAKRCAHYFIPKVNIMSHLVNEDSFEREKKSLLMHLEKMTTYKLRAPLKSIILDNRFKSSSLEESCLPRLDRLFPLNEKLNRRFSHYLAESQWFLPGMKHLHRAIEVNLCLMSINDVFSRRKSELTAQCIDNFNQSLIKREDFESLMLANVEQTHDEQIIKILIKKQLKDSTPIYWRCSCINETAIKEVKSLIPSPLYCLTSCYRANLYMTALKSYQDSSIEATQCMDFYEKLKSGPLELDKEELDGNLPVLVCNSLSSIFDEHLQVVLGFATLHKYISSGESMNSSAPTEVCLKLCAWEFLQYLNYQCELKLDMRYFTITFGCPEDIELDPSTMSHLKDNRLFTQYVLGAALFQNKACVGRRKAEPFRDMDVKHQY